MTRRRLRCRCDAPQAFSLLARDELFIEMQPLTPFFREVGSGSGIVCLHANASHSAQWRMLMERLAPKFRVLAADSYGAGQSPAWPADRSVALRDEVSLLEPVFDRAGERFTLVGHSYGAAVALIAAIELPQRVQALALYEPTLFSVLGAEKPPPTDVDGLSRTVQSAVAALKAGNRSAAAEWFIDYWMGRGSWASMPETRREAIAASIVNIQGWFNALSREPTSLAAFGSLDIPVLYMVGTESPASSRAVARVLARALPQVQVVELEGVGHMGPVSHPDIVNDVIAEFVEPRRSAETSATTAMCVPLFNGSSP
jgi:pimeloyl-ACP methyl ester carboxylesterase